MAKKNQKRVKILVANCAGKYKLPYAKNEIVDKMDADQADEMIDAGDAKECTKEIEKKEKEEAAEAKKAAEDKAKEDSEE